MSSRPGLFFAIIFSILLTISLYYLTLEIPHILDYILHNYYPDLFWMPELREIFLNNVRPIGYITIALTITLIILGFIIGRSYLSIVGSIAIYLPIFGYFAFAMFFLAGIGILRILWLPIIEFCPDILKLGYIVIIPFIAIRILYGYHAYFITGMIAFISMWLGLLIFSLGVVTWLYGRFNNYESINFWIYRYIRHPQYLGYIIWSYGLLLFTYVMPYVRGAFNISPTLPWLVSTALVIGIALYEEIKMKNLLGDRYREYIINTSFMFPIPRKFKRFNISIDSYKDIVIVISLFLSALIISSYIIIVFLHI